MRRNYPLKISSYLKRSKRKKLWKRTKKPEITSQNQKLNSKASSWRYQNGDVNLRTSMSPRLRSSGGMRLGSVSLSSEIYSSTSTLNTMIEGTALTPQQVGLMGMEALETAISYWEDAISAYSFHTSTGALAIPSSEESKFSHAMQQILQDACKLQEKCELLFLNQGSILYRSDSTSTLNKDGISSDYERRAHTSISSFESFVSAQAEIADLKDFDEFYAEVDVQQLPLYQVGLKHLEDDGIPYRTLRTEVLKCTSDVDYLVKVYCLRLAFQFLFKDERARSWFIDSGRQLMTDLLIRSEKDPKEFLAAFDEMLEFLKHEENHQIADEELQIRGVKCMTFYDIVLDYILLDAFEDLENPPSTVRAVIQNRWLSVGFKETALSTAVWSVLKAKRHILKFSDGFISHFYDISEHISPVLAWGFLGPDEDLRDICVFFKNQILGFLEDIFNLKKVRYTTVEELASDLFAQAMQHHDIATQRLSL